MVQVHSESREILAMKAIYGPFDELTDEEAKRWIAPENPGAGGHHGRYLWTDAFGVINFINLAIESSSTKLLILAKRLVYSVHETLGRTRDGTSRLNGATDETPLKGGLRIGKVSDDGQECDGQCHHYSTLWMFALNRLSIVAEMPEYNDMAIELAKSVHHGFVTHLPDGNISIAWKISIDMETTLVPSKGHLDAITGSVIHRLLQDTAKAQGRDEDLLEEELDDYKKLSGRMVNLRPGDDPFELGLGLWISQIYPEDAWTSSYKARAFTVVEELLQAKSRLPAAQRLAWSEFAACLGICCGEGNQSELEEAVHGILSFWEGHVASGLDEEVRPISQAMYVAARIPGGKLSDLEWSKARATC